MNKIDRLDLSCPLGCSSTAELPQGYLIRTGDEPGAVPLSKDAPLVADNQQHYLYGKPVWVRTALIDKAVKSAVRAPQLDLFGPSVFEWVLDNYSEMRPALHLGDGLNLSCAHEFDAFLSIMDHAHQDWFMAPGNHDGIYFGSSESQSEWKAVCDGGGGPISQPTFIRRYLTEGLAGRRGANQPQGTPPVDPGRVQFAREFDVSKGRGSTRARGRTG